MRHALQMRRYPLFCLMALCIGCECRFDRDSVVLALEQRAARAEAKLRDTEHQLQTALQVP